MRFNRRVFFRFLAAIPALAVFKPSAATGIAGLGRLPGRRMYVYHKSAVAERRGAVSIEEAFMKSYEKGVHDIFDIWAKRQKGG